MHIFIYVKSLRSQIRKLIAEASINDKGELVDFEAKTKYPHKKIGKFIKDYINSNFEDWAKMGWSVFDSDYSEYDTDMYDSETGSVWRVEKIDDPDNWDIPVLITLKNEEEAFKKAKEAGFILDENGVILGLWGINMVDSLMEEKTPLKRVSGALIQDQKTGDVFLIKRNDKTPKWAMVTGKIDDGEESIDALEREMYEELFIRPEEGTVRLNYKGVESFPAQNMELYYFEGFVNGKFNPILDEENLDYGWFNIQNLPSPLIGGLYGKIKEMSEKDKQVSYFEEKPQLNEIRKQIRLIMEQKIMPKYYMQEAVSLIKEAEEKSPTYHWDLTNKGVKDDISPTYSWDLTDKGVKDDISPTYHWDLSKDKPKLDSYDIAKEYIDKALSYIRDKASALEFIKDLKEYIKDLSTASKVKLTKYVATALLGVVGFSSLVSLMSNSNSEIDREVISSIDKEINPRTDIERGIQANIEKNTEKNIEKRQEVKGRPNSVSAELIDSLKDEEKLRTRFYDIDDGAYTVGWGHAVFEDPSRGTTGGDYDFVPTFVEITPGVTMLLSQDELQYLKKNFPDRSERVKKADEIATAHAEELLRNDVDEARKKLDAVLDEENVTANIDQHMYDAMVSMVYNMGAGEKFKESEFFNALKRGNLVKAYHKIDDIDSANLLQKYPGLKNRRAKEKERFGRNLSINTNSKEINNLS